MKDVLNAFGITPEEYQNTSMAVRAAVHGMSTFDTFEEMFAQSELRTGYWEESIELCETKRDRLQLARRIVRLMKEARKAK